MGIFSFLGKKDRREDEENLTGVDVPRRRRDDQSERADSAARAERTANSQIAQRDVARKTALKIDAIESEMSTELSRPASTLRSGDSSRPMRRQTEPMHGSASRESGNTAPVTENFSATLPLMGIATDFLLGADGTTEKPQALPPETPAVIEEVAILFANDQNDLVESMLLEAIEDKTLGRAANTAWWMLFDLYQIINNQTAFEQLALRYAAKFETSPPTWVVLADDGASTNQADSNTVVVFSGVLDVSIQKQLDRAAKLSATSSALRFEFTRITSVNVEGCTLLLATLKKLQQAGCTLTLAGGNELLKHIRNIIEVGRRDDTEAPWLLLLETLQLMNRQQDFEEASIDYCVTYEVSPPAFIAPKTSHIAAIEDNFEEAAPTNVFMMPAIIDSKSDSVDTITKFVRLHNPVILDCSRLLRVDFSAASQLLSGFAPLSGTDHVIELHHVNHLVHALFNVMGLREVVRIFPRKQ